MGRTAVASLFVLLCAACSHDDDSADDSDLTPSAETTAAATPEPNHPAGKSIAWIASRSGGATITRDGLDAPLAENSAIGTGDVVHLPDGGRVDLEFEDGGGLWVVGPAGFSVGEMSANGRRVMFGSGTISRAKAAKVAVEIQTPHGANLVLQNCSATATIAKDRAEFRRLGPGFAKVWREGTGAFQDLGDDAFVVGAK